MNRKLNLWTVLSATVGLAAITLTISGCDTASRESAVDTSRDTSRDTSQQQPGTVPSPSAMENSGNSNTENNGR